MTQILESSRLRVSYMIRGKNKRPKKGPMELGCLSVSSHGGGNKEALGVSFTKGH